MWTGTPDQEMALNIVENAKCSRPSVCNAAEVCLADRAIAQEFLPKLRARLADQPAPPREGHSRGAAPGSGRPQPDHSRHPRRAGGL